ncbi:MAG: sugar-binding protein [Planctomycetes bacterium]|nr:sugar-binding protein [Planctomycetota bacterium]MBI3847064.1 sugar-binding protein [Planctomycetota bacterium]
MSRIGVVGTLSLAVLFGCGKKSGEVVRMVVNNHSPFWEPMKIGMSRAGAECGVDVDCVGPQEQNVDAQISVVESLIAQGVTGICISPIDPNGLRPVIQRALAAGIDVICMDSDAPASGRLAYIGTVNRKAGEEAAKTMLRVLGDSGGGRRKVAAFVGMLTAANARERLDGFKSAIAGSPIDLVETYLDDGDAGKAQANVETALQAHPDLAALFTIYSYDGPAAGRTVRGLGLVGKVKIVSFDAEPQTLELLRDGVIEATVVQRPYEFGYRGVKLLHEIRTKGREPALSGVPTDRIIDTGVDVVTREKLAEYIDGLNRLGIKSS